MTKKRARSGCNVFQNVKRVFRKGKNKSDTDSLNSDMGAVGSSAKKASSRAKQAKDAKNPVVGSRQSLVLDLDSVPPAPVMDSRMQRDKMNARQPRRHAPTAELLTRMQQPTDLYSEATVVIHRPANLAAARRPLEGPELKVAPGRKRTQMPNREGSPHNMSPQRKELADIPIYSSAAAVPAADPVDNKAPLSPASPASATPPAIVGPWSDESRSDDELDPKPPGRQKRRADKLKTPRNATELLASLKRSESPALTAHSSPETKREAPKLLKKTTSFKKQRDERLRLQSSSEGEGNEQMVKSLPSIPTRSESGGKKNEKELDGLKAVKGFEIYDQPKKQGKGSKKRDTVLPNQGSLDAEPYQSMEKKKAGKKEESDVGKSSGGKDPDAGIDGDAGRHAVKQLPRIPVQKSAGNSPEAKDRIELDPGSAESGMERQNSRSSRSSRRRSKDRRNSLENMQAIATTEIQASHMALQKTDSNGERPKESSAEQHAGKSGMEMLFEGVGAGKITRSRSKKIEMGKMSLDKGMSLENAFGDAGDGLDGKGSPPPPQSPRFGADGDLKRSGSKEDLKSFWTREENKTGAATREDGKAVGVRDEGKVKEELKISGVKEEIKPFSTKEEPKISSVKDEIKTFGSKEEPKISGVKEEIKAFSAKEEPKISIAKEEIKVFSSKEEPKTSSVKEEIKAAGSREDLQTTGASLVTLKSPKLVGSLDRKAKEIPGRESPVVIAKPDTLERTAPKSKDALNRDGGEEITKKVADVAELFKSTEVIASEKFSNKINRNLSEINAAAVTAAKLEDKKQTSIDIPDVTSGHIIGRAHLIESRTSDGKVNTADTAQKRLSGHVNWDEVAKPKEKPSSASDSTELVRVFGKVVKKRPEEGSDADDDKIASSESRESPDRIKKSQSLSAAGGRKDFTMAAAAVTVEQNKAERPVPVVPSKPGRSGGAPAGSNSFPSRGASVVKTHARNNSNDALKAAGIPAKESVSGKVAAGGIILADAAPPKTSGFPPLKDPTVITKVGSNAGDGAKVVGGAAPKETGGNLVRGFGGGVRSSGSAKANSEPGDKGKSEGGNSEAMRAPSHAVRPTKIQPKNSSEKIEPAWVVKARERKWEEGGGSTSSPVESPTEESTSFLQRGVEPRGSVNDLVKKLKAPTLNQPIG